MVEPRGASSRSPWLVLLLGVVLCAFGVVRTVTESVRSPVVPFAFGIVALVLGVVLLVRGRGSRRSPRA